MASQEILRERQNHLRLIIHKKPIARQSELLKEMAKEFEDYSIGKLKRDINSIGAYRSTDGYTFYVDQKLETVAANNRSKMIIQFGYLFKWDIPIFRLVIQKKVSILHIFFRDNASVDFTAKKIAELFDDRILGITAGFRVVSIYVNQKNDAIAIRKELESFKKS